MRVLAMKMLRAAALGVSRRLFLFALNHQSPTLDRLCWGLARRLDNVSRRLRSRVISDLARGRSGHVVG